MFLPSDPATCALSKILMDFHSSNTMHLRYPKPPNPKWARTLDQEVIRELAARMAH